MEEKNYLFSVQTLVLLSIGLIAFLGFAFLAIEGGRIYITRQQAQSMAKDTAAIACAHGYDAAVLASSSAKGEVVSISSPPVSGLYAGNLDYVEVVVRQPIGFVYADTLDLTGRAVVSCDAGNVMISSVE